MASSTGPTLSSLNKIPLASPFKSIPVFLPKPKLLMYLNNLSFPNLLPRDTNPGFKAVGIRTLKLIMEVYTTNDFAYDGNIYHSELDLKQPKGCLSYTSNHVKDSRKINNRSYDINTSNYKKLTTNKDAKVIELYDDLEDYYYLYYFYNLEITNQLNYKIYQNYVLNNIYYC